MVGLVVMYCSFKATIMDEENIKLPYHPPLLPVVDQP